ncbi:4-hydroxy-3-methylbut-2-enyl diphosphate reductase [Flavisphingomonas formosensis]|uniref:4-hydroxy-3-methylbut-2-enyl diphosphate reductase n=1 Tax=Flavisphingomonas formosensis TaxID=861534 RepID=UPI0012FBF849|nr:4-hydroxy-3-methylbut-2-enyl diphosphate reductase [Sphingomonas formosensis]
MQVILAQPRGFCAGVVRAIEIVERALELEQAPVYVRHEIVHNRHVVDKLRRKGAVFVEDLSEVPAGARTVFSAHGVARSVQEEAAARGLPVLDATCPLVTKVHVQGRRYARMGRTVILIGHEGHAEVIGTMGQIDAPIHLVSTIEDVAALDLPSDTPIAYVTQTTLSVDDTRGLIAALGARFSDVLGPDVSDICYATQNRQTAVRDLCRVADLLLVVGASNSSNSNRLREIGVEMGVPSFLVADGDSIDSAWFDGIETVGLTAGASAPDELVDHVIAALRQIGPVAISTLDGVEENMQFSLPPGLKAAAHTSPSAA